MSLDRTLKQHGRLKGTRSVMTRAERIARMIDEGTFDPEKDGPFGLPKLRVRHSKAGSKTKKEAPAPSAAEAVEGAEGEAPEAAADGTKE